MCGNCCKWPGYVRLNDKEIDRIAAFLGITVEQFIEDYTRLTDDRRGLTLIEKENDYCIFFDDPNTCHIYPVRPRQCRDFPNRWSFDGWRNECPSIGLKLARKKRPVSQASPVYFPTATDDHNDR